MSTDSIEDVSFLLVHGAWHDSRCWGLVTETLGKRFQVATVDLPGHSYGYSGNQVKLQSYVDCVRGELDKIGSERKVILVGHSMAGIILTRVIEDNPSNLRGAVFLSAFVPKNGQSLQEISQQFGDTPIGKGISFNHERGYSVLSKLSSISGCYHDCTPELAEQLSNQLVPSPMLPMSEVVEVSEKFTMFPKIYIECLKDRAVPLNWQRQMQQNARFLKVFSISSGHSPFASQVIPLCDALVESSQSFQEARQC